MNNNQIDSNNPDIKKLASLIKDIKLAMLITYDENGFLRGRPMATQQVEFDGDLWFFTTDDSNKIADIKKDSNVNVSFAEPVDNRFISISGEAEFVKDKNKAKELWSPLFKAWFKDGLDDPKLGLIKIVVKKAEYWDSANGKVIELIGFIKAVTTGKEYTPSEHKKIDLG